MEHKTTQQGPGANGFLFGLIVGVLITLFLVTKKGRKLLKKLGDEGLDIFEEIESVLQKAEGNVADEIKGQKKVILDKAHEVKELVAQTVEEQIPNLQEKVVEMQRATQKVIDALPIEKIKDTASELKQEIETSKPVELVTEKIEELQKSPAMQTAQEKVEETVAQIVQTMEAAQTEINSAKKELEHVVSEVKPKSAARRFFKGIRRK